MMKRQIVECDDWPMVFSAGPGTGKTTLAKEHILWLKSQGDNVLPLTFTKVAAKELGGHTIDSFYYQGLKEADKLAGFNGRNFEVLQSRFVELMRDDTFRKRLQSRYDCIVLDEGQDSSKSQLRSLWEVSQGNLHIFGDIDQCLYEWRDAQPNTLLDFCEYHNVVPVPLTHTYRLTKQVLEASRKLILHNCNRFSVDLETDKDGPRVEYERSVYDVEATMSRLKEVNSNDVAVLARNVKSRVFMKWFWNQGLSRKAVSHKPYAGTYHGAKGLEWENVFIVRADRCEFSRSPIEEERRLFYTAMTRTCRLLHISAFEPVCFITEAGLCGNG